MIADFGLRIADVQTADSGSQIADGGIAGSGYQAANMNPSDAPIDRVPFVATGIASAYDRVTELPVTVLLDNVRSLYNVGAFFRTADAVRLSAMYLSGITANPPNRQIAKTALGAERTVRWERVADATATLDDLRRRHHELVAIETSPRGIDLFDWVPRFPVCVIFGHEVDGVRRPLLDMCDTFVRIPMLGLKQSLNVATAGGVVLFELLRRYRRLLEASARASTF